MLKLFLICLFVHVVKANDANSPDQQLKSIVNLLTQEHKGAFTLSVSELEHRRKLQLKATTLLYVLHGEYNLGNELNRLNTLSDTALSLSSVSHRCLLLHVVTDIAIELDQPAWISFANFAECPQASQVDWLTRAIQSNPAHGGLWYNYALALETCDSDCGKVLPALVLPPQLQQNSRISSKDALKVSLYHDPCLRVAQFALSDRLVKDGNLVAAEKLFKDSLACNTKAITLEDRAHMALVIRMRRLSTLLPVVYSSQESMDRSRDAFFSELSAIRQEAEQLCTGNTRCFKKVPRSTCGFGAFGYYLAYHGLGEDQDKERNFRARMDMARAYSAMFPDVLGGANLWKKPDTQQRPQCRYRVGFLSAFFHDHSVGKLLSGPISLVSAFDEFCVYVFTVTSDTRRPPHRAGDSIARQIQNAAEEVVEINGSNIAQARQTVLQFGLDLLVFGEIGMDEPTYFLAFQRLAKSIAVFWGHGITTGIQHGSIDWYISSRNFHPDTTVTRDRSQLEGGFASPLNPASCEVNCTTGHRDRSQAPPFKATREAQWYTEDAVYLMDGLTTFSTDKRTANAASRVEARKAVLQLMQDFSADAPTSLQLSGHLYLIPQTLRKLTPVFDKLIRAILVQDSSGLIVSLADNVPQYTVVRNRLAKSLGADLLKRVRFIHSVDHETFKSLALAADVVLDPIPYGGGVTSMEVLQTGTPIVHFPDRSSVIQITNALYIEMDSTPSVWECCLATSEEEYVRKATLLATDKEWNAQVRGKIMSKNYKLSSPEQANQDWARFLQHAVTACKFC